MRRAVILVILCDDHPTLGCAAVLLERNGDFFATTSADQQPGDSDQKMIEDLSFRYFGSQACKQICDRKEQLRALDVYDDGGLQIAPYALLVSYELTTSFFVKPRFGKIAYVGRMDDRIASQDRKAVEQAIGQLVKL